MKSYDSVLSNIVSVQVLRPGIFSFWLECPELAALAQPGQFAQIRLPGHTLRRPISICDISREAGLLRFVFQVRGEGTAQLAEYRPGSSLEILAPLGKGFPIDKTKRTLLLGGGIGVPPLLAAAKELGESAVAVLGFRSYDYLILEKDFRCTGAKVIVATDDGSYGSRGVVTEFAQAEDFKVLFACGPAPMLRAAKALAQKNGAAGYLSLEERMACGLGACLGCAVALLDEDGQAYYGHVCKDGPVFPMGQLASEALSEKGAAK